MELKEEMGKLMVTVGDFHTLLSVIDRTIRQKNGKDTEELNNTSTNRFKEHLWTLHPTTAEYTFLTKGYTDGNKHIKRCSTLLVIRQMHTKTTRR